MCGSGRNGVGVLGPTGHPGESSGSICQRWIVVDPDFQLAFDDEETVVLAGVNHHRRAVAAGGPALRDPHLTVGSSAVGSHRHERIKEPERLLGSGRSAVSCHCLPRRYRAVQITIDYLSRRATCSDGRDTGGTGAIRSNWLLRAAGNIKLALCRADVTVRMPVASPSRRPGFGISPSAARGRARQAVGGWATLLHDDHALTRCPKSSSACPVQSPEQGNVIGGRRRTVLHASPLV